MRGFPNLINYLSMTYKNTENIMDAFNIVVLCVPQ